MTGVRVPAASTAAEVWCIYMADPGGSCHWCTSAKFATHAVVMMQVIVPWKRLG